MIVMCQEHGEEFSWFSRFSCERIFAVVNCNERSGASVLSKEALNKIESRDWRGSRGVEFGNTQTSPSG